jgi:hypothetical protein
VGVGWGGVGGGGGGGGRQLPGARGGGSGGGAVCSNRLIATSSRQSAPLPASPSLPLAQPHRQGPPSPPSPSPPPVQCGHQPRGQPRQALLCHHLAQAVGGVGITPQVLLGHEAHLYLEGRGKGEGGGGKGGKGVVRGLVCDRWGNVFCERSYGWVEGVGGGQVKGLGVS